MASYGWARQGRKLQCQRKGGLRAALLVCGGDWPPLDSNAIKCCVPPLSAEGEVNMSGNKSDDGKREQKESRVGNRNSELGGTKKPGPSVSFDKPIPPVRPKKK